MRFSNIVILSGVLACFCADAISAAGQGPVYVHGRGNVAVEDIGDTLTGSPSLEEHARRAFAAATRNSAITAVQWSRNASGSGPSTSFSPNAFPTRSPNADFVTIDAVQGTTSGSVGGTADEPSGEARLPVDATKSCPGFYVLRTHSAQFGSIEGRYGAEVVLQGSGLRTLQGGLNFGGWATNAVNGFSAFSIANSTGDPQSLDIGVSVGGAGWITLERRSNTEGDEIFLEDFLDGQGDFSFQLTAPPGFYVLRYRPTSGTRTYAISALTSHLDRAGGGFQGGAVVGGWHNTAEETSGFAAFCIAQEFQAKVQILAAPTYGATGARKPAFSLASGDSVVLDSRQDSVISASDIIGTYVESSIRPDFLPPDSVGQWIFDEQTVRLVYSGFGWTDFDANSLSWSFEGDEIVIEDPDESGLFRWQSQRPVEVVTDDQNIIDAFKEAVGDIVGTRERVLLDSIRIIKADDSGFEVEIREVLVIERFSFIGVDNQRYTVPETRTPMTTRTRKFFRLGNSPDDGAAFEALTGQTWLLPSLRKDMWLQSDIVTFNADGTFDAHTEQYSDYQREWALSDDGRTLAMELHHVDEPADAHVTTLQWHRRMPFSASSVVVSYSDENNGDTVRAIAPMAKVIAELTPQQFLPVPGGGRILLSSVNSGRDQWDGNEIISGSWFGWQFLNSDHGVAPSFMCNGELITELVSVCDGVFSLASHPQFEFSWEAGFNNIRISHSPPGLIEAGVCRIEEGCFQRTILPLQRSSEGLLTGIEFERVDDRISHVDYWIYPRLMTWVEQGLPGKSLPEAGETWTECGHCPDMVVIPAGSFTQGSSPNEPERRTNEGPRRTVNIPAFAMGRHEITFNEWGACVADGGCSHSPSDQGWGRGNRPVINVNWHDAQEYVTWLSNRTGEDYRLPSESEWEYATRAGTTERFNTGDCLTADQANFGGPAQGCSFGNALFQTLPVGSFAPNAFGLYDTHGNAGEWVQDCVNHDYAGAPTDGSAWMTGSCDAAVVRGGYYAVGGDFVRSAARSMHGRTNRPDNGFRVARSIRSVTENMRPDRPDSISYPQASSSGAFVVSWPAVVEATSYEVDRSGDGGASWTRAYSGRATKFDESLDNGTYRYRVRAVKSSSRSEWRTGAFDCVVDRQSAGLEISLSQSDPEAYRATRLDVSGGGSLDGLVLEIDVSGSGSFRPGNALSGAIPLEEDGAIFIPPPVFLYQPDTANPVYHIRAIAENGVISPVLVLSQSRPDVSGLEPGLGSTMLGLVLKAIHFELDNPLLAGTIGQIQPGRQIEFLQSLGQPLKLSDEHAVALLRATFGAEFADPSSSTAARGSIQSARGYARTMDCLGTQLAAFTSHSAAAENCFDTAIRDVRESVIPSFSEIHTGFATVSTGLSSVLRRPGRLVSDYVEQIANWATATEYAQEFAQVALASPPFEQDPDALTDYVAGKLTRFGRNRLFDFATAGWNEFDRNLARLIDGEAALEALGQLGRQGQAALRALEDRLINASVAGDLLAQNPEAFGSQRDSEIQNPDVPSFEEGQTATEVCQENPGFADVAGFFGLASCEEYVEPFLDESFLSSAIMPVLSRMSEITKQLEANGCFDVDNIDSPACESLVEELDQAQQSLGEILQSFSEQGCQDGYAEFDQGSSLTCVWDSLLAGTAATCPAGSRRPPYSVGLQDICVYFSRDYLRNGSCLENYKPVFWKPLNAMTCRWSDLPTSSPAAYTLDKETRNRRTLVP